MTWWEAEIHCQTHVLPSASDCSTYTIAHLASIITQSEQEFVYTFFNTNANADSETDAKLWIGFNDIAEEGEFVWSDRSTVYYRNWISGQPDDSGGREDCVHIYLTGVHRDEWNDIDCNANTVRHFICKGPARIFDL
ncbi:echinoidin-like [Diadema antillarum]|uniref:echinoidin-like n=1 Tax=Diadema antillarum TaxID=105358 RepID=UPI003A8B5D65